MWEWLIPVLIIVALVVIVGIYLWATYNSLVQLNVRVDEAWSDITVQLKRRADLIPGLIETVKGYAAHERAVFENVTQARAETLSASGPAEAGVAEGHVQQALKSLFAVAEAYPDLKAAPRFQSLQEELPVTKDRIAYARAVYNAWVTDYETTRQSFPSSIVAGLLRFPLRRYFEAEVGARSPITVAMRGDAEDA